jgi:hypothetical protein
MKDIFNRLIPELADIINLQSSALFSVTDDMQNVVLEAGILIHYHYTHSKSFPVTSEPSFE